MTLILVLYRVRCERVSLNYYPSLELRSKGSLYLFERDRRLPSIETLFSLHSLKIPPTPLLQHLILGPRLVLVDLKISLLFHQ